MTKHETARYNEHFWFVYFLGVVSGATGIFLFGTKKGREILEQVIEFAEDFEGNIVDVISNIDDLKNVVKTEVSDLADRFEISSGQNSLNSVIEKIGSALPLKAVTRRMIKRKRMNLKSS